jgi:hypothetical protein
MKITIITAVALLPNGTFLPKFSLIEPVGNLYKMIPYSIAEECACDTEQEACIHASDYGRKEAMKEYGDDVEIEVLKNHSFHWLF